MNTILVLTDLSEDKAPIAFAATLATKIKARLRLVHVYGLPVSMNDLTFPMPFAEIQKGIEDSMLKKKEEVQKIYPHLEVEGDSRIGDLADEAREASEEEAPFAIIMGSRGEKSKSFFGSSIMSVVRSVPHPVLVIPEGYKGSGFSKIVFASDLDITKIPTQQIIKLVQTLGAALHIVNVYNNEEDAIAPNELLEKLSVINPFFRAIQNEEVAHGVQQYIDEIKADILLILPHEHNLMERLFFKLHTSQFVHHSSIPVLCLNDKEGNR